MKLRYLEFAAVMLWGLQTGLWYLAAPMGIFLEARHFIRRRWALTHQDFYRIADLTTLAMVGFIILLFLNRARYHFVVILIEWLPVIFYPLVTALAYSTTRRMPLDVIFYSLRRQTQPVTQAWDMNAVFFGLCLVAAGINTDHPRIYMAAVCILLMAALYRLRSPRYESRLWLLLACSIVAGAWLTQLGLHAAHLAIKEETQQWLANYIHTRVNPLKTHSAIGSIGKLELSDAIAFRIAPRSGRKFPALLQEASYDIYSDDNWMVLNPKFVPVRHEGSFKWRLASKGPGSHHARVYLSFDADTGIVPIPADVTRISDLPALNIRRSHYGSIEGMGMVPSPGYDVTWRKGANINSPPDATDTFIPPNYKSLMKHVAATSIVPDSKPVEKVRDIFRDFRYSLYEKMPKSVDPLAHFLLTSKAGHCEYFATATVLLLRYLGVPARYVVGWSVQEYNPSLGMYIVRDRHAHAWAIAWLHHRWQVVDTTPSVWRTATAAHTGLFRPVLDFVDNEGFLFQLWWNKQKLSDYRTELYIAGALLLLILIWRIARSEQVVLRPDGMPGENSAGLPGDDSPFFLVTRQLEQSGLTRQRGEPLSTWLERIEHGELASLLALHNRLRFDPRGLSPAEQQGLAAAVSDWLARDVAEGQFDND